MIKENEITREYFRKVAAKAGDICTSKRKEYKNDI